MDHRYIDDHSVAQRYLDHSLSPEERNQFEAHLVDCQECADRLLLAEMFHARNGHVPVAASPAFEDKLPDRVRLPDRVPLVVHCTEAQLLGIKLSAVVVALMTAAVVVWAVSVWR